MWDHSVVLFQKLFEHNIQYPKKVREVPTRASERIGGRAFFPGGNGSFLSPGSECNGNPKIMVIGNNFGTWSDFQGSVGKRSEDDDGPTWAPMLKLFSEVIEPANCFFTNVFMGFLDSEKNTDKMAKTREFTAQCLSFLRVQILHIQPELIISLGVPAMNAVGSISIDSWKRASISKLDRESKNISAFNVESPKRSMTGTAVALIHPSFWATKRSGAKRTEFERGLLKSAAGKISNGN